MTLARVLVCLALADANVGQQDSAAAHQAAVAKSQQAHAQLRTLQRQLSSVESTMHSDMDSFLALSDRLDEKDAREGPGLPDVLADGSAPPSSLLQTGGKPALVQTKQAAADKAKSQAAHAKLAAIQKQLASVNAKMQTDMEKVMAISREQDEEDMQDEMHENAAHPSSFAEIDAKGKPALVQTKQAAADKAKSQAAHAKLAAIQKQLASVNAKMQTDMEKVMAISREQDEEDMQDEMHERAASPSSFAETGRKHIFAHEDQGLEIAEDKVHKAEEQLRRMKQEFDQGPDLHFHQITIDPSSFAQTGKQRLMHERKPEGFNNRDPDAVDNGAMRKQHEEAKEFVSHWKHILEHEKEKKDEYNQRREEDGSDPSSLIQVKDKKAEAKATHQSIMQTAKSLDEIKNFLDEAIEKGLAPEDVAVKMRKNEAKEKEWAKDLEEKIAARRAKFNDKINHNLGVDSGSD